MSLNTLEILRRDTLSEGGFAGLREHRLVMGEKFWGDRVNADAWSSAGTGSDMFLRHQWESSSPRSQPWPRIRLQALPGQPVGR